MKKALSVFLTLAVLLSLAYQTVFAAEGTLELLETRNDVNGNVIFVFRFTGDFKKNDFKGGKVFFGDESFPMGCNIVDKEEGIVQCTTSRATAGKYVNINLAGFIFYTFVPERSGRGDSGGAPTCYPIYDSEWDQTETASWVQVGTHCPDGTPSNGDIIEYSEWWYEFWELISDGYCGVDSNNGTGYFELCLG